MPGRALKALGLTVLLAMGAVSSADGERDLTEKVGHKYVSSVTETVIDGLVDDGYRMTDIEVTFR